MLDPYACATYILSYITKGQRGMSRLLEKASEEAKAGNKDITNRVRHIGNKFLNAVEISAQEAVYLVLQIPLRRSSRDVQFISTSPPDERTFLIKKLEKLKELPDGSHDIESDNIIKRYQRRPKQLENFALLTLLHGLSVLRTNKMTQVLVSHHSQLLVIFFRRLILRKTLMITQMGQRLLTQNVNKMNINLKEA